MTPAFEAVTGTDTFEGPNQSPIGAPYLPWRDSKPNRNSGSVVIAGSSGEWSVTRPEVLGPDVVVEALFDSDAGPAPNTIYYLGARLDGHTAEADGLSLWLEQGPGPLFEWVAKLRTAGNDVFATGASQYQSITGMRLACVGSTVTAHVLTEGQWVQAAQGEDDLVGSAGFIGFGFQAIENPTVGVETLRWGDPVDMGALAARFYKRLAPIAAMDRAFGYPLRAIVRAVTRPGEVLYYIVRGSRTHAPWQRAFDPDLAPSRLLRWLALFPGVALQPGDTEDQQRYRIRQAAGFYQATPRALVEELQLVLTGTKTVLLGFHTPDQWHYSVGTFDAETPDTAAVARAVLAQQPAGMQGVAVTTDDWTWLVLAPDLIARREMIDGLDTYVIDEPEYPTWQSVIDAFSTWQHLIDNDPDL